MMVNRYISQWELVIVLTTVADVMIKCYENNGQPIILNFSIIMATQTPMILLCGWYFSWHLNFCGFHGPCPQELLNLHA